MGAFHVHCKELQTLHCPTGDAHVIISWMGNSVATAEQVRQKQGSL